MSPQTKPKHAYPDHDMPMRQGHYTCGGCGESDDKHPRIYRPTRSRYPSPGTNTTMHWDDGRATEPVLVLATSRHKRSVTVDEAKPMLAALWEEWADAIAHLSTAEVITWHSVTEADMDNEYLGESDPGDWHTAGTGSAWVTVLRCDATIPADGAR